MCYRRFRVKDLCIGSHSSRAVLSDGLWLWRLPSLLTSSGWLCMMFMVTFVSLWQHILYCTLNCEADFHLHLLLKCRGRWGTTDYFTASSPVHSLMFSFHLFFCLPCLLPSFTVPCKIVLARPDEQETCPYHFSLCHIMMVKRSLCGLIASWILAQTFSLVTWFL